MLGLIGRLVQWVAHRMQLATWQGDNNVSAVWLERNAAKSTMRSGYGGIRKLECAAIVSLKSWTKGEELLSRGNVCLQDFRETIGRTTMFLTMESFLALPEGNRNGVDYTEWKCVWYSARQDYITADKSVMPYHRAAIICMSDSDSYACF